MKRKKKAGKAKPKAKLTARQRKRRAANTIAGYYPNPSEPVAVGRVFVGAKNPRGARRPKTEKKVPVGKLIGVMYERGGVKYLHKFTSNPPELKTNMTGNKMFIDGGKFNWSPMGVK